MIRNRIGGEEIRVGFEPTNATDADPLAVLLDAMQTLFTSPADPVGASRLLSEPLLDIILDFLRLCTGTKSW